MKIFQSTYMGHMSPQRVILQIRGFRGSISSRFIDSVSVNFDRNLGPCLKAREKDAAWSAFYARKEKC